MSKPKPQAAEPSPASSRAIDDTRTPSVAVPDERAAPPVIGDLPTGGNLDKIREILFGAQMRDYEKRFVRLEERLQKECADLRDEVRRRHEQFESYVHSEFDAVAERLRTETAQRGRSAEETTRELRELARACDQRFTLNEEQATKGARELRQQLLELGSRLSDEIRHKADALAASIEREAEELRGDKTDRRALASLLTEMALRLSDEPGPRAEEVLPGR